MEVISQDRILDINIGPQHPSTHGVLRMVVSLYGETIINIKPIIGYLHRGLEKMAENRTYLQYLPIVDRIDYLSGFFCSYTYLNGIEKLLDIEPSEKAKYIRTITMEMNRIISHLLWLGCFLMDLGASSPFFFAFIEREKIIDILEDLTGSRMMYNYYTLGGVKRDIDIDILNRIKEFSDHFETALKEYEDLIEGNPIFLSRTKNIGLINIETANQYSITGANIRASGIRKDLRKDSPYLIYNSIDFEVPILNNKDSFSRFVIRIKEMRESNKIILQCYDWLINHIKDKEIKSNINFMHIKPEGKTISEVESPRGLLQCIIHADGTQKPYRIKWRTPSFYSVQIINELAKNYKLPDLMSIFGSLDVIMPEVDR